jgi:transcriptional regulator with GAF, ATPase, and Fis domain
MNDLKYLSKSFESDGILNVRISVAAMLEKPSDLVYPSTVEGSGESFESSGDYQIRVDLLLEVARERTVAEIAKKLVEFTCERPGIARSELWLVEQAGLGACWPESPNPTRCLRLVASGSKSLSGVMEIQPFVRDSNITIHLGVGVIGKIAATGQQVVLRDLDKDPGELSGLESLTREQIRGFGGAAVSYKDEILGVIATFARVNLPEATHAWRQIFADHIGAAIANARAFEEIERLKAQLEMRNAYLEEEVVEAKAFGDLVGQSAPLRHIISQIDLVAPTDASVLILGETGTGKELVAREIHRRSKRRNQPLIRVNCTSIPRELYESEFFGHVRGAFTGAVKDRAGRFETAEGGSLFLDEIGEVPLDLQSKLLRVLQEKRYERVGEDRTRLADVRIIGATNRDLKKEVAAGRFREDLYYRLNVFPIQVMPLKERTEDIPLLAKHFIDQSVKELGCTRPRLTRASIARLQNYDWPGNIRELRNVIDRAVIISRGGVLDFDLPVTDSLPAATRPAPEKADATEPEILTEPEMQRRERENLLAALRKTNWKIRGADGAAELLGVKPTTLVTRMQKMGLKRPESK